MHTHVHMPYKYKEGIRSPGTGVVNAVSHHVGSGNQTQVLWENNKCS